MRLFWPFSDLQVAGEIFHSFDPAWLVASTSFLVWTIWRLRRNELPSRRTAVLFIVVLGVLSSIALVRRADATKVYESYTAERLPSHKLVATVPRTFWRWKGIARGEKELAYIAGTPTGVGHAVFPSALNLMPECRRDETVEKFMRYSRFPVVLRDREDLRLANLVYATTTYQLALTKAGPCEFKGFEMSGFDVWDRLSELDP